MITFLTVVITCKARPVDTRDTISFVYMTQKTYPSCSVSNYICNHVILGKTFMDIQIITFQQSSCPPAHIVPEWYFLHTYWSIPEGGVLAMGGKLSVLALPWLNRSHVRSCRYRPIWKWCVWLFVIDFFVLMYCG